jgi:hypothetical protein
VGIGGEWTPPERLAVSSRLAKLIKSLRFMTCGRLYLYDTLLERLAYDLEHMEFGFGSPVSGLNPVMGHGGPFRGKAPDCKHVLEVLCQRPEDGVTNFLCLG